MVDRINISSGVAVIDFEDFNSDTITMTFNWLNPNGTQVNLIGSTVRVEIRTDIDEIPVLTLLTGSGVMLGGEYNIVAEISKVQSGTIGTGKFLYSVIVTDSLGKDNTIITGKLIILAKGVRPKL